MTDGLNVSKFHFGRVNLDKTKVKTVSHENTGSVEYCYSPPTSQTTVKIGRASCRERV